MFAHQRQRERQVSIRKSPEWLRRCCVALTNFEFVVTTLKCFCMDRLKWSVVLIRKSPVAAASLCGADPAEHNEWEAVGGDSSSGRTAPRVATWENSGNSWEIAPSTLELLLLPLHELPPHLCLPSPPEQTLPRPLRQGNFKGEPRMKQKCSSQQRPLAHLPTPPVRAGRGLFVVDHSFPFLDCQQYYHSRFLHKEAYQLVIVGH